MSLVRQALNSAGNRKRIVTRLILHLPRPQESENTTRCLLRILLGVASATNQNLRVQCGSLGTTKTVTDLLKNYHLQKVTRIYTASSRRILKSNCPQAFQLRKLNFKANLWVSTQLRPAGKKVNYRKSTSISKGSILLLWLSRARPPTTSIWTSVTWSWMERSLSLVPKRWTRDKSTCRGLPARTKLGSSQRSHSRAQIAILTWSKALKMQALWMPPSQWVADSFQVFARSTPAITLIPKV